MPAYFQPYLAHGRQPEDPTKNTDDVSRHVSLFSCFLLIKGSARRFFFTDARLRAMQKLCHVFPSEADDRVIGGLGRT